jgi:hypothetical protein
MYGAPDWMIAWCVMNGVPIDEVDQPLNVLLDEADANSDDDQIIHWRRYLQIGSYCIALDAQGDRYAALITGVTCTDQKDTQGSIPPITAATTVITPKSMNRSASDQNTNDLKMVHDDDILMIHYVGWSSRWDVPMPRSSPNLYCYLRDESILKKRGLDWRHMAPREPLVPGRTPLQRAQVTATIGKTDKEFKGEPCHIIRRPDLPSVMIKAQKDYHTLYNGWLTVMESETQLIQPLVKLAFEYIGRTIWR